MTEIINQVKMIKRRNINQRDYKNSTVYRLCNNKELTTLLNTKNINSIGEYYEDFSTKINNHSYQNSLKYLHFFKNLEDLPTIRNELPEDNYFLCKYIIPEETLIQFKGKGLYQENDFTPISLTEYAIPTTSLEAEYFSGATNLLIKTEQTPITFENNNIETQDNNFEK